MHNQQVFKARVDDVLRDFVEHETSQLTAISADLAPVAEQLRATTAEGKRLRAAFCYLGWRSAGQPDAAEAVKAAAALELVHAAALVHDDIIDASGTRRGLPTAHIALQSAIADSGWRQNGAQGLAILVGNLLLSWAAQLFMSCGLPRAFLARALPLWSLLARELVAGECLEILRTGNGHRQEESMEIVRFKTAKYTVERPLHIGATLGGAPPKLLAAFTSYGLAMGEAFQLQDDLLGVFGDAHDTGKANLDDLSGNKPTALVAVTMSLAQGADRAELEHRLGRSDLDADDLGAVREIMERVGARARVQSMVEERAESARAAIAAVRIPSVAADGLDSLASALAIRAS